jgi:hypothetical protein
MLLAGLTIAHVLCTTIGYVGLIAANVWLLLFLRRQHPEMVIGAIGVWRRSAQFFGLLLGVGVLLGFGLAAIVRAPLASPWLLATYALVVLALGTQAAIMVPWQLRANAILTRGDKAPMGPVVIVLVVLLLSYATMLSLMLLRPM